jgi:CP family cyanate transporter-like MFS transporter
MSTHRTHLPPVWLMSIALVAVAANLRTAMASVPPLTQALAADLGLSNAALGALTTLPVLCMGVFAPFAQRIAVRLGAAASVEVAIGCVAVGLALRFASGQVWPLYAGTFLAGVGIALGGTLLPGLVKELFPPERAGLVTGLYMLAMMSGAGASSALAVPLQGWLGSWQASLGSWSVLGVVGALAWLPVLAGHTRHRAANPSVVTSAGLPWRQVTAWVVAAYLAVQSIEFYSTLAWLAPSYTARGWDPTHAGYLLSAFTAAQLVSGLLGPALTDRITDHRLLLLGASLFGLLGQAGLWLAPTAAPWVWALVLGFGQGASFALGLVLMVDYAVTPAASARLAGMAFFVSYTLASFGPATLGAMRDATGGFTAVWMTLALLMIAQLGLAGLMRPDLRKVA